jgi:hypothetical protein
MGKRTSLRPSWTADLAALIASETPVRASCHACEGWRDVDLEALAAVKGAHYDLWGKTTRCRITEGCNGKVRFMFYGRGRFEPMRDP